MTHTSHAAGTTGSGEVYRPREVTEPSGWVGWIVFGGIIMVMAGMFQSTAGLIALFNSDYYLVTESGLLVNLSYETWGWVHLIMGVLMVAAGIGVMAGQMWARVVGVLVAVGSALTNLAFIEAHPLWSLIMITLDVLVIYALIVHGNELKD